MVKDKIEEKESITEDKNKDEITMVHYLLIVGILSLFGIVPFIMWVAGVF